MQTKAQRLEVIQTFPLTRWCKPSAYPKSTRECLFQLVFICTFTRVVSKVAAVLAAPGSASKHDEWTPIKGKRRLTLLHNIINVFILPPRFWDCQRQEWRPEVFCFTHSKVSPYPTQPQSNSQDGRSQWLPHLVYKSATISLRELGVHDPYCLGAFHFTSSGLGGELWLSRRTVLFLRKGNGKEEEKMLCGKKENAPLICSNEQRRLVKSCAKCNKHLFFSAPHTFSTLQNNKSTWVMEELFYNRKPSPYIKGVSKIHKTYKSVMNIIAIMQFPKANITIKSQFFWFA